MERAIKLYETVFGHKLERHQMGPLAMAWFPTIPDGIGAMSSLVCHHDFYKPAQAGALVYFTAFSGDLNNELSRVEAAGGKIIVPKKQISAEYGYMGLMLDTEGNRIAIHSKK